MTTTEKSNLKIKPCPFCGGNAMLTIVIDQDNKNLMSVPIKECYIFCIKCNSKGQPHKLEKYFHLTNEKRKEIIELWNKRIKQ